MVMKRSFFVLVIALAVLLTASVSPSLSQDEPAIIVTLTPYEGNPVLTPGKDMAWEAGGIGRLRIVVYDDLLYMFYHGYVAGQTAGGVGYATSEDGLNWTKYEGNPVFVPDESIAPNGVMTFAAALFDDIWTIYFSPWPTGNLWYEYSGEVLAATAPSPNGPWTVAEESILTDSNEQGWDFTGPSYFMVTRNEDGYLMCYNAGAYAVGIATSSDGTDWVKYDDPTTTSAFFASSDPVFEPNQDTSAWDDTFISQPVVRMIDGGWEMFYTGGDSYDLLSKGIGYATSPDGVNWTRVGDAPLLTDPGYMLYPETVAEVDGKHYLYYVLISYTWQPQGIAVAEITYE